jgi:hypothetical protein
MFLQKNRLPSKAVLIAAIALLASPSPTLAQRGGGGGGHGTTTSGGGAGRPDGVGEKDDLKDFHRVMAVQANADQRDAFAKIVQLVKDASDRLKDFRESLPTAPASSAPSDRATSVNEAIAKARTGNQNFLASFSSTQKSGLKDTTKKLAKADADLEKQTKAFDQIVHSAKPESEQIVSSAASLEKALAGFQSEQLALGKEMSVLLPAGSQELTFNLAPVTNSIAVAGQTVFIPEAGTVSRASSNTSVENGHSLFNLKVAVDLSELQHNFTAILRSRISRSPRCGERTEIQQATLTPIAPASLVVATVHYEHWICPGGHAGESPMEVASGDAEIEVKLTASVDRETGLVLASEINRVTAEGVLRNSLRSGDLGVTLREQIAASLLAALQKTADLKTTLPPAAQSATLQRAQFQDAGAEQLTLVLEGQLQLSDEQIAQLASQLKQSQTAQGEPAP